MSIREFFKNWFFKDCSVMTGDGKNFEASEYMSAIWEQPGFMLPIKKKIKEKRMERKKLIIIF